MRYPVEPLAAAMGLSMNQCLLRLGCSGSTMQDYRARGVTDRVAERLAVRAGFHPFEIWPDMASHRAAAFSVPCEECGTLFIPTRKGHRFCTYRCGSKASGRRYARRRYRTDPEYREAKKAAERAARAARGEAARRKERCRLDELRARTRDEHNARRRELYAQRRESA